jgi:hypothetical protein
MDKFNSEKKPLSQELNFLRPVVMVDLKRFGNRYDGGYILPASILENIDAMISMGINDDWSLESEIRKLNPGITIDAYDYTISARKFRRELRQEFNKFLLFRSNFAKLKKKFSTLVEYHRFFRNGVTHYSNRIFDRINYSYDTTLQNCFSKLDKYSRIFLKMDIEGAEYRVLPDLLSYVDRVNLLAIEFHDTAPFRSKFTEQIKELQHNFYIVHLHGNNDGGVAKDGLPETLEITFINKKLFKGELIYRKELPIQNLDAPNAAELPDLPLIFQ